MVSAKTNNRQKVTVTAKFLLSAVGQVHNIKNEISLARCVIYDLLYLVSIFLEN